MKELPLSVPTATEKDAMVVSKQSKVRNEAAAIDLPSTRAAMTGRPNAHSKQEPTALKETTNEGNEKDSAVEPVAPPPLKAVLPTTVQANVIPKQEPVHPPPPKPAPDVHSNPPPKAPPVPAPPPPPKATIAETTFTSLHETKDKTPAPDHTDHYHVLERRCRDLERQLRHAETHIIELQSDAAKRMDEQEEWRVSHMRTFQEEQARIVAAATEAVENEYKQEMNDMRDLLQQECLALRRELEEEREVSQAQRHELERLLQEAETRARDAEREKRAALSKQESSTAQTKQRQERAVRMAEDKLAHTLAKLDDRDAEIKSLKAAIKELKATTTEHKEVAQEAEEEMDELHSENEVLQQNLRAVEAERDELKKQLVFFEKEKEKMGGLQVCVQFAVDICLCVVMILF